MQGESSQYEGGNFAADLMIIFLVVLAVCLIYVFWPHIKSVAMSIRRYLNG